MISVYVVVPDKGCEFGPPVSAFSTKEAAEAYVEKQQTKQLETDGVVRRGYFIFPFKIDDESENSEKATWVHKDGKLEVF